MTKLETGPVGSLCVCLHHARLHGQTLFIRLLPNLWTRYFENEWTNSRQIGTNGPQGMAMKRSTLEATRSKAKVTRGRKSILSPGEGMILDPFGWNSFSNISRLEFDWAWSWTLEIQPDFQMRVKGSRQDGFRVRLVSSRHRSTGKKNIICNTCKKTTQKHTIY